VVSGFLSGFIVDHAPYALAGLSVLCALLACVAGFFAYGAQREAQENAQELLQLKSRFWRLSEQEERYRAIVEAQHELIVQHDALGTVLFANAGYAGLFGRAREEILGMPFRPHVLEAGEERNGPEGCRSFDEAVETISGPRWIAWLETPLHGADGSLTLLRTGRDVTERVVTERVLDDARARAEAASEAKSRFLATVSHEFRTPLNGIMGMADLILDTPLDAEQTTYARAVKTSGEALLALIDGILDFSKIEAGKIELTSEPFDLHALVEGVVELLAPRAQGKGIEIAACIDPSTPRMVTSDQDRLRQVLVNLGGNAVKFTETGGVGVSVTAREDGGVEICVADTGPGIAPERVSLLFQEFEQGDQSHSRRYEGTGLGLSIVKRIVEHMQGDIRVESEPGKGSRFYVRLTLPVLAENESDAEAPDSLAGKRILIAARSPFEAPYIAQRLRQVGADVVPVENVLDALATIATRKFDILIADYALGDESIREIASEAQDAGILRRLVMLSPFERRDFGSPAAVGFDGYLVKPVRARSLIERLSADTLSTPAQPRRGKSSPSVARPHGPPKRVLLAEDNEINALLAIKSLEKLGAIVDLAKNGQQALALAEASFSGQRPDYDIILMDIRMPDLDGLEATRRIRKLEMALGRPNPYRIVAMTANALKEDRKAAEAAGLDGFLAKPFDIGQLRDVLFPPQVSEKIAASG
jgi:PAS domain S-box-containing protein